MLPLTDKTHFGLWHNNVFENQRINNLSDDRGIPEVVPQLEGRSEGLRRFLSLDKSFTFQPKNPIKIPIP